MKALKRHKHQSGAALFVALIFLVIVTMLSLSAMRSSMLELRMASNQEVKNTAFQSAQAVVDATIGNSANMPTLVDVGATNCMATDPQVGTANCDSATVSLDDNYLSGKTAFFDGDDADGEVFSRVTRLAPLERAAPRSIGTSLSTFSVATYQVDAVYDLSNIGQGRAQIREGLMLLISK